MKSLVLKDLYNIAHNAKSMFFILLVFAFVFIPFSTTQSYIIMCGILCGMMTITTFSFDDISKWTRYAMITPVSKKDLVAGKFFVLLCFSAVGAVAGFIMGTTGGIIAKKMVFNTENVLEMLSVSMLSLIISMILGSISIPLVFKFGAEKARMLMLVSFLIPSGICLAVYQILSAAGVHFTEQSVRTLLYCSPIIALIWSYLMYRISCVIFYRQDV